MELQLPNMQPRQFIAEKNTRLHRYMEENRTYFEVHRWKGTILSIFTPLLLSVHVFLFLEAFESFSFMTFVNLILSLLLLLPWAAAPGLFLYVTQRNNKAGRIWIWSWVTLMVAAEIYWFVYFTSIVESLLAAV